VVANNHKAPAQWFEKKLMDPVELSLQLQKIVAALQLFNKNTAFYFKNRITKIFLYAPIKAFGVLLKNNSN